MGEYDDVDLNLPKALGDVNDMSTWFAHDSKVTHSLALKNLASNPTWSQISSDLADFLDQRGSDDVIVIYVACHGEEEAGESYLFGRNTPRANLAGRAVAARQLGLMLGSSKPRNVLVIVDACVAGAIAAAIADAAHLAVRQQNTRDRNRRYALAVIASTFGLDPAQDGRFVRAFLRTISNERWTGTVEPWIGLEQLMQGLNEELHALGGGQSAECSHWFNGRIELIPNPNIGSRPNDGLFDDEEFSAHFDPASRGASRSEAGSFFSGRTVELAQASNWLKLSTTEAKSAPLFVITGSPGTGKSALLSRVAVLSRTDLLRPGTTLAGLPPETVPPPNALEGVIWCHGKSKQQVIGDIARILGGAASTPDALVGLAQTQGGRKVIAVDALDEAAGDEAGAIAREVLVPLAKESPLRLMIATRKHAIGGGRINLLDRLEGPDRELLDLDSSANQTADMSQYVEARLNARGLATAPGGNGAGIKALAHRIATAANRSFLVAAIAARSAQLDQAGTYELPAEVGEALAGYLKGLPDPESIYDVLRPLAWTRGPGMPWGTVWPAIATCLAGAGKVFDDKAIAAALDAAGDLIVEFNDGGEPAYRLFHEALAEHLRATTVRAAEVPALVSNALLALRGRRRWSDVPRYVRTHLPGFLASAGMLDELSAVLLDPEWARQRRLDTGDPLSTTLDVEAAGALFLKHRRPLDLVPLCHQYSRAMTETLPRLIVVVALSGQHRRARALAANLTDVADRMLAYRALARIFADDHDPDGARDCAAEVERALPAMPSDHRPMAWCWAAEAAVAAGLFERAAECALEAVQAVDLSDDWDRQNGLFWAAMAARVAKHDDAQSRVRAKLEKLIGAAPTFRNQFLQAAAVAGLTNFLRNQLAECLARSPGEHAPVRIGNLALALADAGMAGEMTRLVEHVGKAMPAGEADSHKRWAWALALSGRHSEAVDALDSMNDSIECSKALARIVEIAGTSTPALAGRLRTHIDRLETFDEPHVAARLIRALWALGEHEDALARAEKVMATSGHVSAWIDPRAEKPSDLTGVSGTGGSKTARRAMATSRGPVPDQLNCRDAESAIEKGDLAAAQAIIAKIQVPQFKAEALCILARHHPDADAGLDTWMSALMAARQAGRGAMERWLPLGSTLLIEAGRPNGDLDLRKRIADVEAAWQLELFIGEYFTLRGTMASGRERTRMFTNLMFVPRLLAQTRTWTQAEVRAAWDRGEDGSRLFALGLMQGNPSLSVPELVAECIRTSRSAFEQHEALQVIVNAQPEGGQPAIVVRAIRDEMSGVPRADGSRAWLEPGTDRRRLALKILG